MLKQLLLLCLYLKMGPKQLKPCTSPTQKSAPKIWNKYGKRMTPQGDKEFTGLYTMQVQTKSLYTKQLKNMNCRILSYNVIAGYTQIA